MAMRMTNGQVLEKYAPVILSAVRSHEKARKFEYSEQAYALNVIWEFVSVDKDEFMEVTRPGMLLLFRKLRFPEGIAAIEQEFTPPSGKLRKKTGNSSCFFEDFLQPIDARMDTLKFQNKYKDDVALTYEVGKRACGAFEACKFQIGVSPMKSDALWQQIQEKGGQQIVQPEN